MDMNGTGRMKTLVIVTALCIGFFSVLNGTAAYAEDNPKQVVEKLQSELIDVMKNAKALGYQGRYDRLAPLISASHDLPYIARIVAGRHWRQFSEAQKKEFTQTFRRLTIATYAGRFNKYSGQRFEVRSEESGRRGQVVVRTVLVKSNGDEVELDYLLHQDDGRWRIISVIAEGVSDLSLKRADYDAYLERNGFDALIRKLNQRIDEYAKSS